MQSVTIVFNLVLASLFITDIQAAKGGKKGGKAPGKDSGAPEAAGNPDGKNAPLDKGGEKPPGDKTTEEKGPKELGTIQLSVQQELLAKPTISVEEAGESFIDSYGTLYYFVDVKTGKPVEQIKDMKDVTIVFPGLEVIKTMFVRVLATNPVFIEKLTPKVEVTFKVLSEKKPEDKDKKPEDKDKKAEDEEKKPEDKKDEEKKDEPLGDGQNPETKPATGGPTPSPDAANGAGSPGEQPAQVE